MDVLQKKFPASQVLVKKKSCSNWWTKKYPASYSEGKNVTVQKKNFASVLYQKKCCTLFDMKKNSCSPKKPPPPPPNWRKDEMLSDEQQKNLS